jgi:two-component system NtrC family sensor kinase
LFIAVSTSLQHEILAGTHLTLGERIAGRVAQQPEPVVINEDVTQDERFGGVRPLRPIHASIVCPLMMRGQLIGVLNVNRVKIPDRYTEHDRRNAMILSSLVALALGNASLHKELQVRLHQLSDAQEEMIQSEKMNALGNLLSGVAHELNNPLCGILGYAQLMLSEDSDPKRSKGVAVIAREAERAAEIIGNLLTFARREKPEKRPLGINGVILKTLERKSFDLKVSRIDVRADLDPKVPLVMASYQQLQVMFGHLIDNAQQAMFESHGGGALIIRTEEVNGRVIVTIADDGPGFSGDNARRVFDPFFTTRQVGKGAGLGLSVCFAIVRDHGGTIRATGKPDRGACFSIEIPVASEEALSEAQRAESADGKPDAGEDAGTPAGPRVLVSDGEAHVQDLLVQLLDDMGYRFDTAGSKEGTLEKIRSGSYDALIADFSMPHLEGPALLRALRAEKPDLAQRVIFLSSDPTDPSVREFTSSFGSPLIGKPFSLDAIRTALRRIVERADPDSITVH